MDKESILIIIFSIAMLTEIAVAQPEQWPPRYGNQTNVQVNGVYGSAWQSNYVSPNYNPYANQQQGLNYVPATNTRVVASPYYERTRSGYVPIAAPLMIPIYGNPLLMPPSTMYNPWLSNYGVPPIMAMPFMPLPGYGY